MGSPQVPDQSKKASTLALRAFFAGLGKILIAADRASASASAGHPRHAAPGRRALRTTAAAQPGQPARSLDLTGNVRLLAAEELPGVVLRPDGADPGPTDIGQATMRQTGTSPTATQPLTGNVPVGASLVIHELPIPGYETMSLAAIRARLRSLDVDKLQALLVHEQKNAARPEIIAMIERRIEKIESGG